MRPTNSDYRYTATPEFEGKDNVCSLSRIQDSPLIKFSHHHHHDHHVCMYVCMYAGLRTPRSGIAVCPEAPTEASTRPKRPTLALRGIAICARAAPAFEGISDRGSR